MAAEKERRLNIIISARNEAARTLASLGQSLTSVQGIATITAAAFAALAAGVALATARAIKQEEADLALARALASVGDNSEETRNRLNDLIAGLQDLTTVGDEAIASSAGLLAQVGRLRGEGLEAATKASLDLSAALRIDLNAATLLVAKAAQGNTAALSRYGIVLDEGIPKSERFAALLKLIEERFGGSAEAGGKTFSAALTRITNDMDDLLQSIGKAVIENGALREVLGLVADTIKRMTGFVEENRELIDRWVTSIAQTSLNLADLAVRGLRVSAFLDQADKLFNSFLEKLGLLSKGSAEASDALRGGIAEGLAGLHTRIEALVKKLQEAPPALRKIAEEIADNPLFKPETAGVIGTLNQGLKALGLGTLEEVNKKAQDLNTTWVLLTQALALGPEKGGINQAQFDALSKALEDIATRLKEAGAEVSGVFETATVKAAELLTSQEALNQLFDGALVDLAQLVELSEEIEFAIKDNLTGAALSFGDTLIDAAFGAKIAWGQFFKQLLADLAKAIARAFILRALTAFFTGGAGAGTVNASGVFVGSAHGLQHGGEVRGGIPGMDSVLAALMPGEVVLPARLRDDFDAIGELAREMRGMRGEARAALGGPPSAHILNRIDAGGRSRADIANLIELINEAVERGGFRLVSSEVLA